MRKHTELHLLLLVSLLLLVACYAQILTVSYNQAPFMLIPHFAIRNPGNNAFRATSLWFEDCLQGLGRRCISWLVY